MTVARGSKPVGLVICAGLFQLFVLFVGQYFSFLLRCRLRRQAILMLSVQHVIYFGWIFF